MTQAASLDADPPAPPASPTMRAAWASPGLRRAAESLGPPLLAVAALGWAMAALWPRGDLAAWPAVSLGVLAVAGSWGRGPALQRAVTSIAGVLAALAGLTQIAVLWVAAAVLTTSYM